MRVCIELADGQLGPNKPCEILTDKVEEDSKSV